MTIPNPIVVGLEIAATNEAIDFSIGSSGETVAFAVDTEIRATTLDEYDGAYVVIPKVYQEQVLETKNKAMTDNVTVYEIPITRTTNPHGGQTVLIG